MTDVNLDDLLKDLPDLVRTGVEGPCGSLQQTIIAGITTDPKLCRPGFLYVADEGETVDSTRYGMRLDGRHYILEALNNGALAVLTTPGTTLPAPLAIENPIALITHDHPLSLLGPLCSRFFGAPRPRHIALVTGTNGKTSTVNFCRMLWSQANLPSCSIGNLGGVCSDGTLVWDRDPTLSVPETVTLHRILHNLAVSGFNYVALEATSHAFFDYRLNGVPATIGAFTNLTRDHIDFHQSMEEYFRFKMKLFEEVLAPGSWAVLNADATWFEPALAVCKARGHKIITYGFNGSEIRLLQCVTEAAGQKLVLEVFGKRYECRLNLLGLFQASNVLCSLAIVIASGLSADQAVGYIESLTEVEGRLNTVAVTHTGGRVVVDYAHSPDAIRAALEACRSFTEGKLIIVFGCDGQRDVVKRKEMGAVASTLADKVIVTDDQPLDEDPAEIRKEVLVGAPGADEFDDRARAIEAAIKELGKGDTVLIAGLGHENFRTIGTRREPYSDRETALRIVAALAACGAPTGNL
jgi:UDP-N-acetylmuramoyl-L-alanyl-D-glutamate--2,6-diaminopimelate ligase